MLEMPPIWNWDAAHVQIIHFAIALLAFGAPLLILLAIFIPRIAKPFMWAALALMVAGVGWAFVAVATGEAAAELVVQTPAIHEVLEHHEELGETSRTLFAILAGVLAVICIVPLFMKKPVRHATVVVVAVLFLIPYAICDVILLNTAHHGGLLVHQYGVQAKLSSEVEEAHHHGGEGEDHGHSDEESHEEDHSSH